MVSSLAAQAAANASLHAVSLAQRRQYREDLETVYAAALNGFEQLKALDGRLSLFEQGLFSEAAKGVDRTLLNKVEAESLDALLESFLRHLGPHFLVKAAIRVFEWLVRRFR